MKKTISYKAELALCLTLIILVLNIQNSVSQTYCTESGISRYAGEQEGYRYELWNQNSQGTACMTLGSGALFSGEWSGILNYLARRGLGYDQTQEHQEIGTFYSTYNCDYNPSTASGNSYLSIYGWTIEPLIEFYIVEDWRNWIPSMDPGATLKGTIDVNGSIYDIYENTRVNQPSIIGTATFQQYFSIRRDVRNSGIINISEHFNKWESLEMDMGKMYEVSFVVEGYQSNGSFAFTELDVFLSDVPLLVQEETESPSKVVIYSDPNSGNLSVQLNESVLNTNTNIEIYNVLGNLIFSQKNVNTDLIRISGLKNGIYIVNVYNNGFNHTSKLLVY